MTRRSARNKRIVGGALLAVGVLLLLVPTIIDASIRGAVRVALEQHGFAVTGGDVSLSPVRGLGVVSGLKLERDREDARLEIRVDQALVTYSMGDAMGEPPRLAEVDVQGVRVHVLRRGAAQDVPSRPRSLHLQRVIARDVELILEDRGPETQQGEPFRLVVQVAQGEVEDVWLDDVVRTALLRSTLRGTVAGGTLDLEEGKLRLGGVELSAFSTYLSHAAPLRLTAGKGAVWGELTPRDDGIDAWIYVEMWQMQVEAIPGAKQDLVRDLSLKALVAYLQHRGAFFAHAFRVRVPGSAFNGIPAHDGRALGVALAEGFVRSIVDDRLDPRRPKPRQLHPALRDPFELAKRLGARDASQREEVFAGALHGRVFEGLTVDINEIGETFLGLGKPFVKGEADGGLHVKVRKLPEQGALGARRFDALVAVGTERDGDRVVLVFEPSGED